MDLNQQLAALVDEVLNLQGRSVGFLEATPLLGAVPELDSMGVVTLITALEDRFGVTIDDDEIDGAVFQTWGTLLKFVQGKVSA